jgi:hypothetical protein
VAIAPEQQREVVERADDALQFYAVDQEDRDRDLVLSNVIQKDVLHILCLLGGHNADPFFLLHGGDDDRLTTFLLTLVGRASWPARSGRPEVGAARSQA